MNLINPEISEIPDFISWLIHGYTKKYNLIIILNKIIALFYTNKKEIILFQNNFNFKHNIGNKIIAGKHTNLKFLNETLSCITSIIVFSNDSINRMYIMCGKLKIIINLHDCVITTEGNNEEKQIKIIKYNPWNFESNTNTEMIIHYTRKLNCSCSRFNHKDSLLSIGFRNNISNNTNLSYNDDEIRYIKQIDGQIQIKLNDFNNFDNEQFKIQAFNMDLLFAYPNFNACFPCGIHGFGDKCCLKSSWEFLNR